MKWQWTSSSVFFVFVVVICKIHLSCNKYNWFHLVYFYIFSQKATHKKRQNHLKIIFYSEKMSEYQMEIVAVTHVEDILSHSHFILRWDFFLGIFTLSPYQTMTVFVIRNVIKYYCHRVDEVKRIYLSDDIKKKFVLVKSWNISKRELWQTSYQRLTFQFNDVNGKCVCSL